MKNYGVIQSCGNENESVTHAVRANNPQEAIKALLQSLGYKAPKEDIVQMVSFSEYIYLINYFLLSDNPIQCVFCAEEPLFGDFDYIESE